MKYVIYGWCKIRKQGGGGNYSIHWGKGVEYFGYIYVMGNYEFYVIKKKI